MIFLNHSNHSKKEQHAYNLLITTLLLKAKLAFLDLDLEKAKHLLLQAELSAKENKLDYLEAAVSEEHDRILNIEKDFNKVKSHNISLAELSSLAQIDDSLMLLFGKQELEIPKLSSEQPVLLLILSESGLNLFLKTFNDINATFEINEQLLSGFLSAINSFSGRVFSRNLNRAKLGEYNLVMQPVEELLMMCYIFKGSTYLALQKISKFINSVNENPKLWVQLTNTIQDGIALKSSELQKIDQLASSIFLS